jgi:hypothetical protein
MKKVFYGCLLITGLLVSGCHFGKPAYDDVKVDKKTTGDTKTAEPTATQNPESKEDPIAKAEKEAGIGNPPTPTTPPAEEKKVPQVPEFLDTAKGQIKDLPPFPKSRVVNVQYGPINGISSAMYIYQANETPENVAAFFEKSVTSNGWKILSRTKEPDNFEFTLGKGTRDEGIIRVKKDTQSKATVILLSRAQSPEGQDLVSTPEKQPEKKK